MSRRENCDVFSNATDHIIRNVKLQTTQRAYGPCVESAACQDVAINMPHELHQLLPRLISATVVLLKRRAVSVSRFDVIIVLHVLVRAHTPRSLPHQAASSPVRL